MEIKLTEEQKKHLNSLRWLFMGPRSSGRTTLLAEVLIETVLETKEPMQIADHSGHGVGNQYLAAKIQEAIIDRGLPLQVKIGAQGLVLTMV